jgi:MFS family permease
MMEENPLSLKRLWVLMATGFVDMMGFALVLPLLPLYAKNFGATPFMVGILLSSFALMKLASSPSWGRISDRLGRRPIIICGQALSGMAYLLFGLAEGSVLLLLTSRILQGVGAGTLSVNLAYISDVVGPKERAKALGWVTACTSAGVMIGPAIGSLAADEGNPLVPGLIAASLCFLNVLFAWRWLPEPEVEPKGEHAPKRRALSAALGDILRRPSSSLSTLIWIYTAGMMVFMGVNSIMALYLNQVFGVGVKSIGLFYIAIGFVSMLMRALVLGGMVARLGEVRVLRIGALLLAIGMCLAPLASSSLTFLLAMLFIPAGTAFLFPCTTSLVSRHAAEGEVGQAYGVQQFFGGISQVLAPLWATAVFGHIGVAVPFWICATLVLSTAVFSLRLPPERAKEAKAAS